MHCLPPRQQSLVNLGRVGVVCGFAPLIHHGAGPLGIADKGAPVAVCIVGASAVRGLDVVNRRPAPLDHGRDFRESDQIQLGGQLFAEQGKVCLEMKW